MDVSNCLIQYGFWPLVAWMLAVKAMLFYSYRSTDFEVHRNWMAVTHSLPLSQWYIDATSQWTLDYPPLFAYFERLLAVPAAWVDPDILRVQSEPYMSTATVMYMRATVLACDVILALCVWRCVRSTGADGSEETSALPRRAAVRRLAGGLLLAANAALLLVDSVHFQYNGLLTAVLLLSVDALAMQRCYLAAFWYFVLVNMKHIYLYLAPAYAAIYLKEYCFAPVANGKSGVFGLLRRLNVVRCTLLCCVAALVFAASFGPFVYHGQLLVVLRRLFPVGRGLTHAYWAPNAWALYLAADWCLRTKATKMAGGPLGNALAQFVPEWFGVLWLHAELHSALTGGAALPPVTYTSGLVQVHRPVVLPDVGPAATATVTAVVCVLSLLPAATAARGAGKRDAGRKAVDAITAAAFTCYMFGYHVHEKAVILITVPLALAALDDRLRARQLLFVSTVGHCSLLPLFAGGAETPVKYAAVLLYLLAACAGLKALHGDPASRFVPFLSWPELLYLCGFVPLELYNGWAHFWLRHDERAPFLPLLATSVYCALGMAYAYIFFMYHYVLLESSDLYSRYTQWRWRRQQERLRQRLITENTEGWQRAVDFAGLRYVAGVDIAAAADDERACAVAAVLLHYPSMEPLHSVVVPVELSAAYVPGYLAFREAEPMRAALRRLVDECGVSCPLQLVMVDGNGLLHPRRFGSASHLGVLLDVPTVGVAKSLHHVAGLYKEPATYQAHLHRKGDSVGLRDQTVGDELGRAVLLGDEARNPSFVSVGHRIDLDTAERLAVRCSRHRVPEPIRRADFLARRAAEAWYDE